MSKLLILGKELQTVYKNGKQYHRSTYACAQILHFGRAIFKKEFSRVFLLLFNVTVLPWLQSAGSKRCHIRWLHSHFWVASERIQYLRDTQKRQIQKRLPLWVNNDTEVVMMQSLQTRLEPEPVRASFQHHSHWLWEFLSRPPVPPITRAQKAGSLGLRSLISDYTRSLQASSRWKQNRELKNEKQCLILARNSRTMGKSEHSLGIEWHYGLTDKSLGCSTDIDYPGNDLILGGAGWSHQS